MGFLKQLSATVIGGLIVAIILRHLDFIETWIANRIWIIIFYVICISIGGSIGLLIVKKLDFFIHIFCVVCKWFKIIFTINELEARIAKLEPDENNTELKETSKKNTEVKKMPTLKQKLDSQGYAIGWEEIPDEDMI